MYKKIAVISDIHSNAIALNTALQELLKKKIDLCIVLGDLLTYGTQPNEVIELLLDFETKIDCVFIKGNHDQFYFDIANGIDPIKYKMADFVKESIYWTVSRLNYDLYSSFKWVNNYVVNDIYFAHANPFEYGDWRYLNSQDDILLAATKLQQINMNIGIFGHTHRSKKYLINNALDEVLEIDDGKIDQKSYDDLLVLNSGSIGQPRGTKSNYVVVEIKNKRFSCEYIPIEYNTDIIVDGILNTSMSQDAKNKLNSFWEINND